MKNKITKINRHNDVLMKYIFANESRKANTLSLINAVLDAQGRPLLIDLEFQDKEIDPEHINDKGVLLDVLGKTSDNITINVEIKSSYYKHMTYRTLYYWTKLYTLNLGEDYNKLRRTISINILDFILFKKKPNDYHSMFMLLNVNNPKIVLTDHLEIHYIEIPKFNPLSLHHDIHHNFSTIKPIDAWMLYLSKKTSQADLEELSMNNDMIKQALEDEKTFMTDPVLYRKYILAEKARMDAKARKDYIIDEAMIKVAKNSLLLICL